LWGHLLESNRRDYIDPPVLTGEEGEEPGPESDLRSLQVAPEWHGERLDKVLAQGVAEFSRSYLQQVLESGLVQLNGQVCHKPAQKVRAGDRLQVELRPTPQSQAFRPEPVPFAVVHEDPHLLVVNKPAGLVVHPAPGNWSGTLLNGLLAHDPCFLQLPRAGIVHRLDKDTSGLMVVAKRREVMDALVRAIAAREVSRQYLALAQGRWIGPNHRTVDAAMGRDPRNRLRMAVLDAASPSAKPARTDFEWLSGADEGFWVRCILHTGRTHQIRVHLASIGHPLVADALYGGSPRWGIGRQALHATRLAFVHPATGAQMQFDCPLAADLAHMASHWSPALQSGHA